MVVRQYTEEIHLRSSCSSGVGSRSVRMLVQGQYIHYQVSWSCNPSNSPTASEYRWQRTGNSYKRQTHPLSIRHNLRPSKTATTLRNCTRCSFDHRCRCTRPSESESPDRKSCYTGRLTRTKKGTTETQSTSH